MIEWLRKTSDNWHHWHPLPSRQWSRRFQTQWRHRLIPKAMLLRQENPHFLYWLFWQSKRPIIWKKWSKMMIKIVVNLIESVGIFFLSGGQSRGKTEQKTSSRNTCHKSYLWRKNSNHLQKFMQNFNQFLPKYLFFLFSLLLNSLSIHLSPSPFSLSPLIEKFMLQTD